MIILNLGDGDCHGGRGDACVAPTTTATITTTRWDMRRPYRLFGIDFQINATIFFEYGIGGYF